MLGPNHEQASFDYDVQATEHVLYEFYNHYLLTHEWQPDGHGYIRPGGESVLGEYAIRRDVGDGVEFTGFDGSFLGAPWFRIKPRRIAYLVTVRTWYFSDYPPGTIHVNLILDRVW